MSKEIIIGMLIGTIIFCCSLMVYSFKEKYHRKEKLSGLTFSPEEANLLANITCSNANVLANNACNIGNIQSDIAENIIRRHKKYITDEHTLNEIEKVLKEKSEIDKKLGRSSLYEQQSFRRL